MGKRLQILLLEDVASDARQIGRELSKARLRFVLRHVTSGDAYVKALAESTPDLILSEYSLPSFDGKAALRIANQRCPEVPFIFVSGAIGEEVAIECLREGATDYVFKDRMSRLEPAVQRALREAREHSQRKEVAEALRREHDLLERITESSPVGILVTDQEGRIVLVNERAAQIFGTAKAEMTKRAYDVATWRITDHQGKRLSDRDLPPCRILSAGEPVFGGEHAIIRPDGHRVLLSVNAEPLVDESGNIDGVVSTVEDVTKEKEMQKDLVWLASFPQLNPNPILEITLDGVITYLNAATKKLFPGIESEGVEHPALAGLERFATKARAHKSFTVEEEVWADGALYWRGAWRASGEGRLRVYMVDITDRKRAEEALRDNEEKYRRLVEASPDAIAVESHGRIVFANHAMLRLVGTESEDRILGSSPLDFGMPDLRRGAEEGMRPSAENGTMVPSAERRLRRLDGSTIDIEMSHIPFVYEGEPAVQIVARDISERKQIDQMKSDFISTLSHELRSPLGVISGYAQLLERSSACAADADSLLHAASKIRERVATMTRLVETLLETSRIQSGQFALQLDSVDVGQLVARCAHAVALTPHHTLDVDIAADLPTIHCDPNRLPIAVGNLLSNAVKFSPDGGALRVSVRQHGERIRISVKDEGIGVKEEERGRIFERFTQADMSSTRPFGGTGMGLYIARQIVAAHGGDIDVDSVPGKGSTFTIELSLSPSVEDLRGGQPASLGEHMPVAAPAREHRPVGQRAA